MQRGAGQVTVYHSEIVEPRDKIVELGAWLGERPSLGELKPRCEALLAKLD